MRMFSNLKFFESNRCQNNNIVTLDTYIDLEIKWMDRFDSHYELKSIDLVKKTLKKCE